MPSWWTETGSPRLLAPPQQPSNWSVGRAVGQAPPDKVGYRPEPSREQSRASQVGWRSSYEPESGERLHSAAEQLGRCLPGC